MYAQARWSRDLYALQQCFGMSTGVEQAAHYPNGVHLWIGLQRADIGWLACRQLVDSAGAAMARCLGLVQDEALRILTGFATPAAATELSSLERSLLSWTLDGVTADELQSRTMLDRKSITSTLHGITSRLRATSKWQAAARAYRMGLIS
jgi:DNA-binding CsgD family transcriptional regulator